jgi:N6-adenosine-specific RNA methylase IME4
MPKKSSILYQNSQQTAFLVDVPASIELAQIPSSSSSSSWQHNDNNYSDRQLLSSKPLEKPYPSPPEPKSQAARARLLARIPQSEILFYENIAPFVRDGLDGIRNGFQGAKWCKPRRLHSPDGSDGIDPRKLQREELEPPRKRVKKASNGYDERSLVDFVKQPMQEQPPLILSSSSANEFSGLSDLRGVQVKNPSHLESAIMQIGEPDREGESMKYTIPPGSSFVLDTISSTTNRPHPHFDISPIIPRLPPTDKFNVILFDPPWPNRSVRRSSQYPTHGYLELDSLIDIMQQTILTHLNFSDKAHEAMVGVWTTNNAKSRQAAYTAFENTGLEIREIWIWLKTTEVGELVSPLDGLWRKPYEVLFLARPKKKKYKEGTRSQEQEPLKRIIAAVPDEHSRKPNLKELLESLFFHTDNYDAQEQENYTTLEVFARNLTAGWCACGNDVLKFNAGEWWFQP